jgi:uncharacterized protein GlcG (DUF336 family)
VHGCSPSRVFKSAFYPRRAKSAHGKFVPQTGAALIKDAHGNILGAAGASGVEL